MNRDYNAAPINPLPAVVWILALPLIAMELLLTLAEVPQGCSSIFPTWVGLDSRRVLLSG